LPTFRRGRTNATSIEPASGVSIEFSRAN